MEGTDSGGGRRIGLRLGRENGWMDGMAAISPSFQKCTCATVEASTATCTGRKAKTERGSFS